MQGNQIFDFGDNRNAAFPGVDGFYITLALVADVDPVFIMIVVVDGEIGELLLILLAAKGALYAFAGPFTIALEAEERSFTFIFAQQTEVGRARTDRTNSLSPVAFLDEIVLSLREPGEEWFETFMEKERQQVKELI